MKYYFMLLTNEEGKNGINIGKSFAYNNRSRWVEGPSDLPDTYLTVGLERGIDFVVYNDKAYDLRKAFIDLAGNFVVFVCVESIMGCDK